MPSAPEESGRAFEDYPLTRAEYISAMVHLYRAELTRANTWRIRLDTTTNWSIISVIGLLSFAFGTEDHHHGSLVLGMLMVLNFLVLEARRYRFFDVWKNRVRMIEENFYTPLLRRDLTSPEAGWGALVAADLANPTFKISYLQALKARLVRNYLFLFVVLLLGWLGKLALYPAAPDLPYHQRFGAGPIPWYATLVLVVGLYLFLAWVALFAPDICEPEREHWSGRDRGALPDF
ncbi:MAG: DUF2270 domain-containing protein [Thermoanaerobaculia bacterium]